MSSHRQRHWTLLIRRHSSEERLWLRVLAAVPCRVRWRRLRWCRLWRRFIPSQVGFSAMIFPHDFLSFGIFTTIFCPLIFHYDFLSFDFSPWFFVLWFFTMIFFRWFFFFDFSTMIFCPLDFSPWFFVLWIFHHDFLSFGFFTMIFCPLDFSPWFFVLWFFTTILRILGFSPWFFVFWYFFRFFLTGNWHWTWDFSCFVR